MKRIYFAHTVNSYNTDLEKELLGLIKDFFGTEIENPNQPHHQVGYNTWKKEYQGHPTKSGMSYFYEKDGQTKKGGALLLVAKKK